MYTKSPDKTGYNAIMDIREWDVIRGLIETTHEIRQTKNVGNYFIIETFPIGNSKALKKFYVQWSD